MKCPLGLGLKWNNALFLFLKKILFFFCVSYRHFCDICFCMSQKLEFFAKHEIYTLTDFTRLKIQIIFRSGKRNEHLNKCFETKFIFWRKSPMSVTHVNSSFLYYKTWVTDMPNVTISGNCPIENRLQKKRKLDFQKKSEIIFYYFNNENIMKTFFFHVLVCIKFSKRLPWKIQRIYIEFDA